MPDQRRDADWRPGSFTKNFSWGPPSTGLVKLHEHIRVGFDMKLQPVRRDVYEARVRSLGRPWYVAANFFLYSFEAKSGGYLMPDELVFQALTQEHDRDFDRLALFALNLSIAGTWPGADRNQSTPSLWAHYYIANRIAKQNRWDVSKVSADDIETFLRNSPQYKAEGTRKLSTNLNYLYMVGGLSDYSSKRVERWWVNCLFLALDRISEERARSGANFEIEDYPSLLEDYNFHNISGPWSLEKQIAVGHLSVLYSACGGRRRLSAEHVESLIKLTVSDVAWLLDNDPRPSAAFHPTNLRTWKTIPTICAQLAKNAGFDVIPPGELELFDAETFIRQRTRTAIQRIHEYQIRPKMTAAELDELTREK